MPNIAEQNPVNLLSAPRLTPSGKAIVPIIKNAFSARQIHKGMWDADASNRLTRAWVQGILEGKPPYDPAVLRNAGLANACNLDWRDGQLAIRKKMVPYVEALNSLPTFMRIKTSFGASQSERDRYGKIMSEKHKKLFTSWDAFTFRYLYKVLYLASHGQAFAYFDNRSDWRWNVSCPGDMVVPRMSRADTTEFDVISTYRDFQPHELYAFIKGQDANAKWTDGKEGWHVPTTRQAILKAGNKDFFRANDWELNERLIKDNELYYSWTNKVCQAIVMFVKEVDGSVTQMIMNKDAIDLPNQRRKRNASDEPEKFLYKETGFYSSMKEGIIAFARDIGTNGDWHSIRGTGSDIFPMVQKLNELKCGLVDATEVEMSIPIQASEEVLTNEFAYTKSGPFLIINQNVKMLDRQSPNYSHSALPAMEMIQRGFLEQQGERMQNEGAKPPQDLEGLLDNLSGIDVMESTLWHTRWQMLLQQSLRRLRDIKSSSEPGGKEAYLFRKWCMDAGVPAKAIDAILWDDSEAVRAIGNGSPQGRLFTLDRMEKVVPQMDEQGRRNWVRAYIGALPGTDQSHVDEFAPAEADMRPGVEVKIAMMENQILMTGGSIDPLPDEPHLVHVENHIRPMIELQQKVESGEMDESQAVTPLMPLFMHAQAHLMMAGEDPMQKYRVNQLRQALHNMGEIITNGQRKLLKMQEDQQDQQQEGQPVDPEKQAKAAAITQKAHVDLVKAQAELGMAEQNSVQAQQLHEMKMEQQRTRLMKDKQDMNLKDISTAAKIAP